MPSIHISFNPLQNINDTQCYSFPAGKSPREFFSQHPELQELQVICVVNKEPRLRTDGGWDAPLKVHDVVLFIARPKGGGDSNPMRLILTLAVLSFAGWAVGAMGLTGMMAGVVKMGIVMAGSMLINQLLPLPQPPEPAKQPEPSPTYSLRGQTNIPRLGQPIEIHLGEHICYPSMIMQPYYEYEGSDQWYFMLCCLGVGKIVPSAWKFGDIDFSTLGADVVQYQVAYPNQSITLIPAVVYSSSISGTELSANFSSSAYSNPPNTQVNQIGVDFAFAGLVSIGDQGEYLSATATAQVQVRQVDDANNPLTGWSVIITKTYTNNTVDTIRDTVKATVAAGRYEVQTRVTAPPSTDSKVRNKCTWGGLRGYGKTHPNYGDVTVVAVKIKATELLSQQSTQQLNIVGARHLREWNGSWSALKPSRSIVWALADLYLNNSAGRQAESTLLLSELKVMHDKLNGLGHYFDYRFDQSGTKLLEAMNIAARAGRCALFYHMGYWRITRDDARSSPVQMFTSDNIKEFGIDIAVAQAGEPDGITGKYIRPDTWQSDTITIPKSGVTASVNPEMVDLTGITGRTHAWDELNYLMRAESRRTTGYLVTGMEGRIPVINDLIAISPDGIEWGEHGTVIGITGTALTLSKPTNLASGKITLRSKSGKPLGTTTTIFDFARISANTINIPNLPAGITTGTTFEPTGYILGAQTSDIHIGRVKSTQRIEDDYVRINFFVEDSSVYDAISTPPVDPNPPLSGGGAQLNIAWMRVSEQANGDNFRLNLSWANVPSANQYALELSTNGGSGWSRIYTGANAQYEYSIPPKPVLFRVAAINGIRGEWYSLSYTVGSGGNVSPPPTGLGLQAAFTGAVCRISWTLVQGISKYRLKVYDTATLTERRSLDITGSSYEYSYLMATDDGGPWRNLTFRLWSLDAAGNQSVRYSQIQVNNPQVGALQNIQVTGFQGQIMVTYDWPSHADAAGVLVFMSPIAGFTPDSTTQVYDGADSVISIPASTSQTQYLRLAAYDYWGADNLTYSAQWAATAGKFDPRDIVGGLDPIPVVNPLPNPATWTGYTTVSYGGKLYKLISGVWTAVKAGDIEANSITAAMIQAGAISADKIAANTIGADKIISNSITSDKLSVANLAAISANLGKVTTGMMQNASGRAVFNLDAAGAQPFINLKAPDGSAVFHVGADGQLYVKGNIRATSIQADSAIITSELIAPNTITSLEGSESNTTGNVHSITFTAKGSIGIVFFKLKGIAPSLASNVDDMNYPSNDTPIIAQILLDGTLIDTFTHQQKGGTVMSAGNFTMIPYCGYGNRTLMVASNHPVQAISLYIAQWVR